MFVNHTDLLHLWHRSLIKYRRQGIKPNTELLQVAGRDHTSYANPVVQKRLIMHPIEHLPVVLHLFSVPHQLRILEVAFAVNVF